MALATGFVRVVVLSSFVMVGATARAQDERGHARELVAQGMVAFDAHDYQLAIERFEEAYSLARVVEIRLNIALALERLARLSDAVEEYERVIGDVDLDAASRQRVERTLADLRSRLSTLTVIGVAGASVRLDGVEVCRAPCQVQVDPGRHEFAAPGVSRSVQLVSGQTLEITLPAIETIVRAPVPDVRRSPSWATWVGLGAAALGAAGTIGFGLRTRALRDDFDMMPTDNLAERGDRSRLLTNTALGVAITGVVAIVIDLILRRVRR